MGEEERFYRTERYDSPHYVVSTNNPRQTPFVSFIHKMDSIGRKLSKYVILKCQLTFGLEHSPDLK